MIGWWIFVPWDACGDLIVDFQFSQIRQIFVHLHISGQVRVAHDGWHWGRLRGSPGPTTVWGSTDSFWGSSEELWAWFFSWIFQCLRRQHKGTPCDWLIWTQQQTIVRQLMQPLSVETGEVLTSTQSTLRENMMGFTVWFFSVVFWIRYNITC